MNKLTLHTLFLSTVLAFGALSARADDEAQTNLRLNPNIENTALRIPDYANYGFLNTEANSIDLNGADWSELRERYQRAKRGEGVFNIVYLGDSHIQADFGGSILRARMAEDAGSAGRGIIIPFRMAGTNQPVDYTMRTSAATLSSRLLKQPWVTAMPFTGIGVAPVSGRLKVSITSEEAFDSLSVVYSGDAPTFRGSTASAMTFSRPVTEATIELDMPGGSAFGGVVLGNGKKGVRVHSIGNNGAQYSSYTGISDFGEGLAGLEPDLIIVALGTNEAFGAFSSEVMDADVEALTTLLRTYCPDSRLLLVTPTECMRKRYRGRGRRRRAAGLTVNTNVARARSVVTQYARTHGLPLYDTYTVAGGTGAASRMKNDGILGRDGVHFTATGYRLWGSLLADALLEQLNQ